MGEPKPEIAASPSAGAELVRWYSATVGMLFGVGLAIAVVLAILGQQSLAIVVIVAVLAIVVPWKLLKQRQEVLDLIERHEQVAATAAATKNRVEAVNGRVDHVHQVTATIDQVNSVRTWADSISERVKDKASSAQLQAGLASLRESEREMTRTERDKTQQALKPVRERLEEQATAIRKLEFNRDAVQTRIEGFATKDASLGLAIEQVEREISDLPELRKTTAKVERRQLDIVEEIDLRRDTERKVVIGLGTGRSGTSSLHHLLDSQFSAFISHERRPLLTWEFSQELIAERLDQLMDSPTSVVGDVAFYYLPYVRYIAEKLPQAKFVCMRRDREKVVKSFMTKTGNDNLWTDHDGSEWDLNELWDPTMPSYAPMPKDQAIGRYWDEYYEVAAQLSDELGDRFRIFDLEGLFGDAHAVKDMLDFIGIEESRQRIIVDVHVNEILTNKQPTSSLP